MAEGASPHEQSRLEESIYLMRRKWEEELGIREFYVESRAQQKAGYYARKKRRRMAAEDEAQFLLSPGRIRGYDTATRSILHQKLIVKGDMRIEAETSPQGLEFTSGKAVAMLVQLSACALLAKAMVD